jgi:hypothetical protein
MPLYKLSMKIFDSLSNTYDITLDTAKFRVPGSLFAKGGNCFVPIFPHNLEKDGETNNDWYMGSHSLSD